MKSFLRAIAVFLSSLSGALGEVPNFLALGDLDGAEFESHATAVSADGKTVVGWGRSISFNPAGNDEAFRWGDNQMQGLGALYMPPPTDTLRFSRATGVNGDGSLIAGDSCWFSTDPQSFTWQNNTMNPLFGPETYARHMASNGNVALASRFGGPSWSGYRITSTGYNPIPMLPGGDISFGLRPASISSDGSTVVGVSSSGLNQTKAFRWTLSGGTQALGSLPGVATTVSGDGSIIVGGITDFPTSTWRWTAATGMVPFNIGFIPSAMSDNGLIMVGGNLMWDADHGTRTIKDVLASLGVFIDPSPAVGIIATDISPDGTVIVGDFYNYPTVEAFRAVIPEPTNMFGLLAGFLSIRRRIARCSKA